MNIILNNRSLNEINIDKLLDKCTGICKKYFSLESGKEPYRLLHHMASLFNNCTIIDLGTSNGGSALALSQNLTNQIYSFDIVDRFEISYLQNNGFENMPSLKNCDFIVTQNFIKYLDTFLDSQFIYLDIAHDGIWEKILIDLLIKYNYKGLMILDDIHAFPEMKKIWDTIDIKKIDVTKYGHWSGTGVLDFNGKFNFILD
jgi:predicted O-methyltransferase YrrM